MSAIFVNGRQRRLWLVLSAIWLAIGLLMTFSAWREWEVAHVANEEAKIAAFAETIWAERGIESYLGAKGGAEEARDRAYDTRENRKSTFYRTVFLTLVGPILIIMVFRVANWVAAGRSESV